MMKKIYMMRKIMTMKAIISGAKKALNGITIIKRIKKLMKGAILSILQL